LGLSNTASPFLKKKCHFVIIYNLLINSWTFETVEMLLRREKHIDVTSAGSNPAPRTLRKNFYVFQ
jgi:hypothetical protein